MRAAAALLGIGLLMLAGVLASIGWRHGRAAVGPVLAGAVVSFAAFLWVDCRQCQAGALYVGALASLPFFAVGWIALGLDPYGLSPPARAAVSAASLFTILWSALITATATFGGACPCRALGWGDPVAPLRAVGTDRLVGPLLLAASAVTLLLAGRAARRFASRGA
ncbi:hypothetical protein [Alsobacter sp. SYSU BS001988]